MTRQWAVVELMGHRSLAGCVEEREVAGVKFLRVECYARTDSPDEPPRLVQYVHPQAVYAITPCAERVAREAGLPYHAARLADTDDGERRALPAPDWDQDTRTASQDAEPF